MLKRLIIYTVIQEVLILIIMLFQQHFTLLQYIDLSFYVGFSVFIIGLIVYIMRSGFLDRVHDGFRKVSRKFKGEEDNEFSDMMLSELVGIPYLDILISSLIVLASSFLVMLFYYM
ncbi:MULTISPECIES: DUF3899 domain-containing protein [Listeria]|uniref:DUF3899 domain-containing protein n=1 Tax=Listeria TaxID=1637 RepID=UPI000B592911|nr:MULTISPECIES: DUF3899 domain-containing protein [Listeria]